MFKCLELQIWSNQKTKIEVQTLKMLLHRGIPEKEPNNQKNLN